jgi:membrane fusion protein
VATLAQEAAENEARRTQVITAARDGTVTLLALSAGQPVQPGQLLASIAPAGTPLQAHLFAPSRVVGFVAVGQEVRLRYAAFPYQKFGLQHGRVASVSRSPVAPAQLPAALAHLARGTGAPEALYRLTIDLASQQVVAYGEAAPLKAGMTLDAAVIQDRRRVIEWLFEPLIGAAQRRA